MKILKNVLSVLLVIVSALCLISCADDVTPVTNQKNDVSRKDILLDYALFQDYKMTDEEVENSLMSFLNSGDVNSKGLTSSFSIKKIDESIVTFDGKCNAKALTTAEQDDIKFSVYEIENKTADTSGFAVTSNDMRIGDVLCYIDSGEFQTDISDNPGMIVFANCLNDYVEQTEEIWDEITDEDIQAIKEEYGITDEDIEAYKNGQLNSKGTSYGAWKMTRGDKAKTLLTTKWNQNYPYNEGIAAVYGKNYLTGCVATAAAQLMAYHEWPQKYTSSNLTTLKTKWYKAKDWNGVYDWKAMKNSLAQPYLGALMYEVAEGSKMSYGTGIGDNGSGAYSSNAVSFLKQHGYKQQGSTLGLFEQVVNGDVGDVVDSLDKNRPVLIDAYRTCTPRTLTILFWKITIGYNYSNGHCWLLDGYYQMKRDVTTTKRILFWTRTSHSTETQTYVHCNYGWGSASDGTGGIGGGWYNYGVFNASSGQNYQYQINTYCNIYPAK